VKKTGLEKASVVLVARSETPACSAKKVPAGWFHLIFFHPWTGGNMHAFPLRWRYWAAPVVLAAALLGPARADLNPAALIYKLPNQIEWKEALPGAKQAVLRGDPSKPGPYIVLIKWSPHAMSRPHFHPNDRFITVLSGTWWVGTGSKFDPDSTVPMPAGSFVTHFGKGIHYDGAKDEEAMIEIVGEGPATATPAETK
jgi:hypothetical protein